MKNLLTYYYSGAIINIESEVQSMDNVTFDEALAIDPSFKEGYDEWLRELEALEEFPPEEESGE